MSEVYRFAGFPTFCVAPRGATEGDMAEVIEKLRHAAVGIASTLTGDEQALAELVRLLQTHRNDTVFGVATGRTVESALSLLEKAGVPRPDVLITAVGSEIHYGERHLVEDRNPDRNIGTSGQAK